MYKLKTFCILPSVQRIRLKEERNGYMWGLRGRGRADGFWAGCNFFLYISVNIETMSEVKVYFEYSQFLKLSYKTQEKDKKIYIYTLMKRSDCLNGFVNFVQLKTMTRISS